MRRPDVFTLDYSHPLAQGLVFAGMLDGVGSSRYAEYSPRKAQVSVLGTAKVSFDSTLSRGMFLDIGSVYSGLQVSPVFNTTNDVPSAAFSCWLNRAGTCTTFCETSGLSNYRNRINVGTDITYDNFNPSGGTVTTPAHGVPTNIWAHFTFNIIPSFIRIYINGSLFGEFARDAFVGTVDGLNIGNGRPGNPYEVLVGAIADPLIYNRALSPAEIVILADRTDPMLGGLVREVNPVVYFDFGGTTPSVDNLTASDLVTGSPVLGTPALGQVHALTATGITTSAPALGTPALGQVHGLAATALVAGSPALGTPALTENAADVDALTAVDLVGGSPVLGAPSFGHIHVLGSDGLVTGVPVLGTPLITQVHTLEALGLTVGVPVLGTPALNGSDIVLIDASEVGKNYRSTLAKRNYTARL